MTRPEAFISRIHRVYFMTLTYVKIQCSSSPAGLPYFTLLTFLILMLLNTQSRLYNFLTFLIRNIDLWISKSSKDIKNGVHWNPLPSPFKSKGRSHIRSVRKGRGTLVLGLYLPCVSTGYPFATGWAVSELPISALTTMLLTHNLHLLMGKTVIPYCVCINKRKSM